MTTVHGFTFTPYADWSDDDHPVPGYPIGQVPEIIWHHAYRPDLGPGATVAQEIAALRSIEDYHYGQGWGGRTGYQFLGFQSGRMYEGRGVGRTGAHTVDHNSTSIACCWVIDGDKVTLTPAAISSGKALVRSLLAQGALRNPYRNSGHHDYAAKSCPGLKVYPTIDGHFAGLTPYTTPAPAQPTYRVGVVVRGKRPDGSDNVIDREQARVLARHHTWALVDWPHPGVTIGHAICVGLAADLVGQYPSGEALAGPDRDSTAKVVGARTDGPRTP